MALAEKVATLHPDDVSQEQLDILGEYLDDMSGQEEFQSEDDLPDLIEFEGDETVERGNLLEFLTHLHEELLQGSEIAIYAVRT